MIVLVLIALVFSALTLCYYCCKHRQISKEYLSLIDATVVEIQHIKGSTTYSYLVTVKYNDIIHTFNDKKLFYHTKPGDVIPVLMRQKYNYKNKLLSQELQLLSE